MAELTVPSLDFTALGQLPQVYKKAQADELRQQTLAGLGQGPLDAQSLKVAGIKLGDMGLLGAGVTAENTLYQHGRDDKNDTRQAARDKISDSHWAASFGLQKAASARADEDKFTVQKVENPDGTTSFFKYNGRTGDIQPIGTPSAAATTPNNPFSAGGKFNGDQGKAAGFTDRMLQSEGILSGVGPTPGEQGPVSPGVQGQGADITQANVSKIPVLGNYMVSNDQQKYSQAKADFINAQLRRESGAAIGKDEFANADKQYFPVPGDKPEVIRQKAANRKAAVEAMGREGGGSYKPKLNYGADGTLVPYGQPAPAVVQAPAPVAQPVAPAPPQRGQVMQGYRFKGGDPSDQNNWVKAQ